MKIKSAVAVAGLVTILTVGTVTPTPARASTTDTLIIAGAALAGYVAVVVIVTALIYNRAPDAWAETPVDLRRMDQSAGEVRFVRHCQQTSADVTLVCW